MLRFFLDAFRYYVPMILGVTYVLGYERKKLDNLLKFFIISVHLSLLN